MNPASAAEAYRTASIENAPPLQIVRLLYQGALRFLDQAMLDVVPTGTTKFTQLIGQVDDIVVELRLSLDPNVDNQSDVPGNLERLYLYCESELHQALSGGTKEPLGNARRVLEILLDAWNHVDIQNSEAA